MHCDCTKHEAQQKRRNRTDPSGIQHVTKLLLERTQIITKISQNISGIIANIPGVCLPKRWTPPKLIRREDQANESPNTL